MFNGVLWLYVCYLHSNLAKIIAQKRQQPPWFIDWTLVGIKILFMTVIICVFFAFDCNMFIISSQLVRCVIFNRTSMGYLCNWFIISEVIFRNIRKHGFAKTKTKIAKVNLQTHTIIQHSNAIHNKTRPLQFIFGSLSFFSMWSCKSMSHYYDRHFKTDESIN